MKKPNISWIILSRKLKSLLLIAITSLSLISSTGLAKAYTPPPPVNPQSTVVGLTGTIPSPPPTQAATIASPGNGQSFTSLPYKAQGICQTGLLIKLFINNVFAGAAYCVNGSYSITAALFNGVNVLVVRDYDALDQQGPDSNIVTVYFNNPNIGAGQSITLTSNYAKLGTAPGSVLSWPINVSGGSPSYALSIVWGDGKPEDLKSQPVQGNFNINHIYNTAGVYTILVKATDSTGNVSYLQLVGFASGKPGQTIASTTLNTPSTTNLKGIKLTDTTLFIIIGLLFILPATAFWLGSRHRLVNIKKRFESGQGL